MLTQNETNIRSHLITCGKKFIMFIYTVANENDELCKGSTKQMIEDKNYFVDILKKQNDEIKKDNDILFEMRNNLRVNLNKLETFKKIYNKHENNLKKYIKILETRLLLAIIISFILGFMMCKLLFV